MNPEFRIDIDDEIKTKMILFGKRVVLLFIIFFSVIPSQAYAFDHSHTLFSQVLEKHVYDTKNGYSTRVDYSGFKKDIHIFGDYLNLLSSVSQTEFHGWSKNKQLAFLINAYNGFTIKLILDNYPVKSIKKIGSFFSNPWKIKFVDLFNKKVSLDDIEHEMIRAKGVFDEPRIHFAIVCASIGCPPIKNRAFVHDELDEQLEKNLKIFLKDKTKNRYNEKTNKLEVSKIFKWFEKDFSMKYKTVNLFFAKYAALFSDQIVIQDMIRDAAPGIEYTEYDWNLNQH